MNVKQALRLVAECDGELGDVSKVEQEELVLVLARQLTWSMTLWQALVADAEQALHFKNNKGGQQAGTPEFAGVPVSALLRIVQDGKLALGEANESCNLKTLVQEAGVNLKCEIEVFNMGKYTPVELLGETCELDYHEHGSHYVSKDEDFVSWKDGQLVSSSVFMAEKGNKR